MGALVVIGSVFRRQLFANAIIRRSSCLMFALSPYVLASDVAAWRAGRLRPRAVETPAVD